jgi:hypothetical protein
MIRATAGPTKKTGDIKKSKKRLEPFKIASVETDWELSTATRCSVSRLSPPGGTPLSFLSAEKGRGAFYLSR